MKKVLTLLFYLLPFVLGAQTNLSFTPLSPTDYIGPGRGSEVWINHYPWNNASSNGSVQVPNGTTFGKNQYNRFNWYDFENITQGSYNFASFDQAINNAIDNGAGFSFGVMTYFSSSSAPGWAGSYPLYLHNLMQSDVAGARDWQSPSGPAYPPAGTWVPNWNSQYYLPRLNALLSAIASHIASGTHSGKNYKDVIYYIDIRGYGDFGEWHMYNILDQTPAGRVATSATLDSIVAAHKNAFPNYPLVIPENAFDHGNPSSGAIPLDVSYYIATTSNAWGLIGWRRDNWGLSSEDNRIGNSPYSFNGLNFSTWFLNAYKSAPVVGEPSNNLGGGESLMQDFAREMALYHPTSVGNGNYLNDDASNGTLQANVIAASRQLGYSVSLTGGSMTTTLSPNASFNLTINWNNAGIAPTYDNWNVTLELRTGGVGSSVVWSGTSTFQPKPLQPGSTLTQNDNFTLGAVANGTYNLYMIVKDPVGFKAPFPLMITGRGTDGSYLIRSGITVSSANQPPTAQITGTSTITLPTNSVLLDGTTSFAAAPATISSYLWTNISGPNTPTIASPSGSTTNVTGLIQGAYVFSLKVTDNNGLTDTAEFALTVNPQSTTNHLTVFTTQTPPLTIHNDGQALELGMKFRSSIVVSAIGVRFYKVAGNNGTHIGELYDRNGNRLASAVYTSETSSGWQEVYFSQPVLLQANTTYLACYFSPGGFYIYTGNGLLSPIVNGYLTGLADGTDGHNGVYIYSPTPAFPTQVSGVAPANYWVDIIAVQPCCLPGHAGYKHRWLKGSIP